MLVRKPELSKKPELGKKPVFGKKPVLKSGPRKPIGKKAVAGDGGEEKKVDEAGQDGVFVPARR